MHAILGSHSNGHLNCLSRNIEAGVRNCECIEPTVVGNNFFFKCTGKARPILDEYGNYSMASLRGHDKDWHSDILQGLDWEELSWKMDDEEPDAALAITIALNKKNDAAMSTGHLEIVKAMQSLLKPSPKDGRCAYEPVRDKLIEWYGCNVDNPEFCYVYRFFMAAGGEGSPFYKKLADFTTIFVNQKKRKMQLGVYALLSKYPVKYPSFKNACLKWSWTQPVKQTWCPIPVDIGGRLLDDSKFVWKFMPEVEEVLFALYVVADTVLADSAVAEEKRLKAKTCWVTQAEVAVISLLFAYPKLNDETQHAKQQKIVAGNIAECVAKQLLVLMKKGSTDLTRQNFPTLPGPPGNNLMKAIMVLVRREDWSSDAQPAVAGAAEVLAPTVVRFSLTGKALSELPTVQKKEAVVDTLPWDKWVALESKVPDDKLAKLLLETVVLKLHRTFMSDLPNISMMRTGKDIAMRAKQAFPKATLVIPMFFRKANSMVMDGEQKNGRPRNGVQCWVDWCSRPSSTDDKRKFGTDVDDVHVNVFVAPEVKTPKGMPNEALEWTKSEELHPFWFVKRGTPCDKPNMELIFLAASHIIACDCKALVQAGGSDKPVTEVAQVSYPCLVNTVDIEPDKELILSWSQQAVKPPPKKAKQKNAFDQLADSEAKDKKARTKRTEA